MAGPRLATSCKGEIVSDLSEFEEEVSTAVPEEAKECKLCGYVLAGVGLVMGAMFLYMSFDVLTGGRLTSALGLGTARVMEEGDGDDS